MKSAYTKTIVPEVVRVLLILLFCYTAVNKWLSYDDFIYQLKKSPFLSGGYTFLSIVLPMIELTISLLLIFRTTELWGFAAAACLLIIFTGYIICMLLYAPDIPCSCGGFISSLTWKQHIILNSAMATLAFLSFRIGRNTLRIKTTT